MFNRFENVKLNDGGVALQHRLARRVLVATNNNDVNEIACLFAKYHRSIPLAATLDAIKIAVNNSWIATFECLLEQQHITYIVGDDSNRDSQEDLKSLCFLMFSDNERSAIAIIREQLTRILAKEVSLPIKNICQQYQDRLPNITLDRQTLEYARTQIANQSYDADEIKPNCFKM